MKRAAITSSELPPVAGAYSPAVPAGDFIYVSGHIGQDAKTGKLVDGGIERQTEQIFINLRLLLNAAGKDFDDVVRVGVFLKEMSHFPRFNAIYEKHFDRPYPARTTVAVSELPMGAAIEIDIVVKS